MRHSAPPSFEGLRRAREESRQQRERGWLRTQPRWKTVEYKIGDTVVRDHFAPTEPNAATLVANNPFLPDAPTSASSSQGKLDYNAMYMWHLRMNGEREKAMRPWRAARRIRWRPGMAFR